MFNLFSKTKKEVPTMVATEQKSNSYPQVVQDIHNEFFTAGDKILCEAESVLRELEQQDLTKGKRLAALGFNNTREAVAAIETENKVIITKDIAEMVTYYKRAYPFNKFITEQQVMAICEKYGLVCGDISAYKGFVPENKITQIENFSLKKEDIPYAVIIDTWHGDEVVGILNNEDILTRYGHNCIANNSYFYVMAGNRLNTEEVKNANKYKSLGKGLSLNPDERYLKVCSPQDYFKLKICAPLKDMQVKSNQQVVGHKIQNIPDPIVLQPVKSGYLIICAWGDEASDPIVVNEIQN